MAFIKIGDKTYNEKYLDQNTLKDYKRQLMSSKIEENALKDFSAEDTFINRVKTHFGAGTTLPKLVNESEGYTQARLAQEEENKKNQMSLGDRVKQIGTSAREMFNPSYGYSREQLDQAKPSAWENIKGAAKGVGRFATDVAALVPLAIQGTGALIGNEGMRKFGEQAGSEFERVKDIAFKPSTVGEAKASGFMELGLNVLPMGEISKGKFLGKIAKETEDVSKIVKLLEAGKLLPKNLPKEDVLKVAESLLKVTDEKSILNTIYAESIFKKAELAIGRPLTNKAKMMIELSVKTTPVEDPKAFTDALVEKVKASLPPEQRIVKTVDTAGATIEKNGVGDVVRIIEKDGRVSYKNDKLIKALKLPETNPLIQEARKYKSAEEFVKAHTDPLYEFKNKDLDVFKDEHIGKGTVKDAINDIGGIKNVQRGTLDISKIEPGENISINAERAQRALKEIQSGQRIPIIVDPLENGNFLIHDGNNRLAAYKHLGIKDIPVIAPKGSKIKILDKSQLTDIWNKANKSQPLQEGGKATEKVIQEGIPGKKGLKKVGIATTDKQITIKKTEKQLLKSKLKQQELAAKRGFEEGKSFGRKLGSFKAKVAERERVNKIYSKFKKKETTIEGFKKSVRQYASDLPKPIQRKILSQVKFEKIKSSLQLKNVLDDVDKARKYVANEIKRKGVLKEVSSLFKTAREKGILGKVKGKIRELGFVDSNGKPLKNIRAAFNTSSREKLLKIKSILLDAMDTTPGKLDRSNVDFKTVKPVGSSKSWDKTKGLMENIKNTPIAESIKGGLRNALGVASSNVRKYGGDKLFYKLRERTLELNRLSAKYAAKMEEFQTGIRKINKDVDHTELSDALFNQDFARAREIAKRNGFEKSLDGVVNILEDIHKRAVAVGLKVGKMQDYFPRIVKDYDGLFAAYNKKFGNEGRSYLDKLLNSYANSKLKNVDELSVEEKAEVLTNALRGYGQGKINIGSVGKARQFKELPVEFLQYYHSPEDALTIYTSKMNDRITLKKLFGLEDAEQDSIGGMLAGMKLSPDEMHKLKMSLGAILSPQGQENMILNKLRKSATITLLAHVSSTLFQIADIGVSAYKHGGMHALSALFEAKPFKRNELFTEILHEFSDSTAIKKSLKYVGFDRLDQLNSEAFMAAAFRKAGREAKAGSGVKFEDLKSKLMPMFQGDEAKVNKVMEDLANQVVNKDTQFYVFNEILDVSPRALMEMPEAYLRNPNARLFYSMKSYGIKILDVYRNDVVMKWKKDPKQATKNFVLLTGYLTASGATGAQVRDWYNGKDTNFSDNVINNFLQLSLLSTYDVGNLKRDGLGRTILSKALPPSRVIDDISRDITSLGDDKGLYSVRNIPIIGTDIYNRVGRGAKTIAKYNKSN